MAFQLTFLCVFLVISTLQDVVSTQGWSGSGWESGSGSDSDWTTSAWWSDSGSGSGSDWSGSGSGSGGDWSGSGSGSGWYDGNGVWHPDESSGWMDGNGVWHPRRESESEDDDDDDDHHGRSKGLIIGAFVFGGLLTLAVILAVTICLVHASHQRRTRVSQDQNMSTAHSMHTMPTAPDYPRQPQPHPHSYAPPPYSNLNAAELGKAPDYDNLKNDAQASLAANSLSNNAPFPLTENMYPATPAGTLPPIQHSHQLHQPMYGQDLNTAPLPPIVRHFETPLPKQY